MKLQVSPSCSRSLSEVPSDVELFWSSILCVPSFSFLLKKNPEFGTELKFINSKFHAPNLEHFEVTRENLKMCGVSMLHQHETALVLVF